MPERCSFCGRPIESTRVTPEDGRPYEEWCCTDCGETWRHPEETVPDRSLDFNERGDQLNRRNADTDLDW